jgi:hypothetical protein
MLLRKKKIAPKIKTAKEELQHQKEVIEEQKQKVKDATVTFNAVCEKLKIAIENGQPVIRLKAQKIARRASLKREKERLSKADSLRKEISAQITLL